MSELPSYEQLMAQAREVAAEVRPVEPRAAPQANVPLRNAAIIGGGAAIIAIYGNSKWWSDGFTRRFHTREEGWFGRNTTFSGVDKLGHAYTSYFAVRAMTPLFEAVGNSPRESRKLAAWTSWGTMTALEVADGFSRAYDFSGEDFIANTAGVALGYALLSNPRWDDVIDFRLSYRKSRDSRWDPAGDYAGQRYHLVVKADGVAALRDVPILKYLELDLAYGVPGVGTDEERDPRGVTHRRRQAYLGVSLNLSRVLADLFYGGQRSSTRVQRGAEFGFELFQAPGLARHRHSLDP